MWRASRGQCTTPPPPPVIPDPQGIRCGEQAGGALCPDGLCCGKGGYCGTTTAHCGEGCQSQCTTPPPPPPPVIPPQFVRCGRQAGGALCSNGLCCSIFGYCGTTPAHCCEGCQSQCEGHAGDVTLAQCNQNVIDARCVENCMIQCPVITITL
ncbi:Chitin-binding [Macleaya cordata]|uniref:Chitin-binding n=1 Tax=Macleaya cordata TaxID=56857 RepID=A0A200PQW3_MACCD|nr:Chitin-binding [Macleaya cordata]